MEFKNWFSKKIENFDFDMFYFKIIISYYVIAFLRRYSCYRISENFVKFSDNLVFENRQTVR